MGKKVQIKNQKITITKDLVEDLKKYAKNFCVGMAGTVRDKLTATAAVAIESFYQDYSPKYYKRHYYNFRQNSFNKYYENKHGHIIRGGVELSSDDMDDIYQDPTEEVFDMVYHGYHGVASGHEYAYRFTPVRIMNPSPLQIIEETRDYLYDHIEEYTYYGYRYTKKDTYETFRKRLHLLNSIGG